MASKQSICVLMLLCVGAFCHAQPADQKLYGIGAYIDKIEGGILIKSLMLRGVAFRAGINCGDVIIEIEGESARDMSVEQARGLHLGEQYTIVHIRIQMRDNEIKSFELKRDVIAPGIQARFDYIFAAPGLASSCVSASPLINSETDYLSDHYPVAAEFSRPGAKRLKIVTYNVLSGFKGDDSRKKSLAAWIKKQGIDVLALQELDGFTQESLKEFTSAWGHDFVELIIPAQGPPVGITSKYEIKNTGTITTLSGRAVLQCEVNGIILIVLHFFPESDRQKISAFQNGEAKAVLATTANFSDKDCLILGDFNALSGDDRVIYGEKNNLDYTTIALFLDHGWVDLVRRQNDVPFMQATFPTRLKK